MADISILLVDDSGTMRKVEKLSLAKVGYTNIREAIHGQDALNKIREERPDLVLCDWNMPEMNGLQFVHAVRGNPDIKDLPIIMLTTVNTKEDVLAVMKAGANDLLNKPFTPDALKERITKLFP